MKSKLPVGQKERDYLFDNMKAILIIFVVMGHLVVNACKQDAIFNAIYCFIYMFHMPVFVFITGYFSKNVQKSRDVAVEKYLIPYFIFCIFLQVEDRILNIGVGKNLGFNLLYPQWGMWYLIALFWWKLFIKDFVRIRFILPLSILVGLLSGFSREIGSFLSIGRAVNLLFFFLLGYYCTKENVEKLRKLPKILGVIPIVITGLCAYFMTYRLEWSRHLLFMKRSYMTGYVKEEIAVRIMIYVVASLMIFAMLRLCSNKKNVFTYIGTNSVSVYVIHLFIVKIIERFYDFSGAPWINLVLVFGLSFIIAAIAGCTFFAKLYEKCVGLVNQIVFKKE